MILVVTQSQTIFLPGVRCFYSQDGNSVLAALDVALEPATVPNAEALLAVRITRANGQWSAY